MDRRLTRAPVARAVVRALTIYPKGRRILRTFTAPELPSGGDVLTVGDSVCATAYDDATLVRIDRTS